MCGRFALGAQAEQLAVDLHQQYFVPPPPPPQPSQPRRSGAGSPARSGGRSGITGSQRRDAHGAHDGDGQTSPDASPATGGDDHKVQWASLEAQNSFRPRYNVAPTTRIPVLRRSQKNPDQYELDLLKWGLVPQ